MWHDSHAALNIAMQNNRHAWHGVFICETWLIHMWDMTHWHVTWLTRSAQHRHARWQTCMIWRMHMWDMTHLYVRHDSWICNMTHTQRSTSPCRMADMQASQCLTSTSIFSRGNKSYRNIVESCPNIVQSCRLWRIVCLCLTRTSIFSRGNKSCRNIVESCSQHSLVTLLTRRIVSRTSRPLPYSPAVISRIAI